MLRRSLEYVLDFILPPRCPVTGDILDRQGMLAPQAWAAVNFIGQPQCKQCGVPFDFESEGSGGVCMVCLKEPPCFHQARAAVVYDEGSRNMILAFKHGDHLHYAKAFLPWLLQAGKPFFDSTDFLVPVPLHHRRLLKRRYNPVSYTHLTLPTTVIV